MASVYCNCNGVLYTGGDGSVAILTTFFLLCGAVRCGAPYRVGRPFSGNEAEGGAIRGGPGQEGGRCWRHDKT